jgi:hypothetical protein
MFWIKNTITALIVLLLTSANAQEITKKNLVDSIANSMLVAHSNLGTEAIFKVTSINQESGKIGIKSAIKNTIKEEDESMVIELSTYSDVFTMLQGEEFVAIVSFKEKMLIQKRTTEFQNLFHDEVTQDDLREETDLWFIFSNQSEVQKFENFLGQYKKLTQQ